MSKDSMKTDPSPAASARIQPPPNQGSESPAGPIEEFPGFFDQTTEYIRDPETDRWIVKNPAGSTAYNALYHRRRWKP